MIMAVKWSLLAREVTESWPRKGKGEGNKNGINPYISGFMPFMLLKQPAKGLFYSVIIRMLR